MKLAVNQNGYHLQSGVSTICWRWATTKVSGQGHHSYRWWGQLTITLCRSLSPVPCQEYPPSVEDRQLSRLGNQWHHSCISGQGCHSCGATCNHALPKPVSSFLLGISTVCWRWAAIEVRQSTASQLQVVRASCNHALPPRFIQSCSATLFSLQFSTGHILLPASSHICCIVIIFYIVAIFILFSLYHLSNMSHLLFLLPWLLYHICVINWEQVII